MSDRFWSKVRRGGPDECWPWLAGTNQTYGIFWLDGKAQAAHRVAYEMLVGPIGAEDVDHTCGTALCVNPAHLTVRPADADRFWAKVDKTGDCWLWTGNVRGPMGYGRFAITAAKAVQAHRYAYEMAVGPVPVGLQLDHLCRTPRCVRPNHLEAVTPRENTLRGNSPWAINARKKRCPQGHPYSGDNLLVTSSGRACRTCQRLAWAKSKQGARDRARGKV